VNRAVLFSGVASAVLWCAAAFGEPYRFTNIADTTTAAPIGTFTGFRHAAISGGTVAFEGEYGGGHGVFTGAGGALTTVVKSGDLGPQGTFSRTYRPIISGESIAFAGEYGNPGTGYFLSARDTLRTIVKTGDLPPFDVFNGAFASFALSGENVAFIKLQSFGRGVFVGSGGPVTTIAPSGAIGVHVAISNGTIVFPANCGHDDSQNCIRAGSSEALTTIVEPGDLAPAGTFRTTFRPTIDDDIVTFAGIDDAGLGIFTIDAAGTTTTIVRVGDAAPAGTFQSIESHANSGTAVAFLGVYADGLDRGLFLGSGGAPMPVIQTGDSLFGSTVVGLGWTRFGFDVAETGNLAFTYSLADGRSGVVLASLVPEPFGLFVIGTAVVYVTITGSRGAGVRRMK
jgi:hypothetical protein